MHSKNLFEKKIRVLTPLAITPALPFVVGAWPSVRGVKVSDERQTKMSWYTAAGQQARGARVEQSRSAYPSWAQGISSRGQETNGEVPRWNYRKVINGHARKIHQWCQGNHDGNTKSLRQRQRLEVKHIYLLCLSRTVPHVHVSLSCKKTAKWALGNCIGKNCIEMTWR